MCQTDKCPQTIDLSMYTSIWKNLYNNYKICITNIYALYNAKLLTF